MKLVNKLVKVIDYIDRHTNKSSYPLTVKNQSADFDSGEGNE